MMLSDVERLTVFVDDILQASRIAHRRRSQTWTVVDVTRLLVQAAWTASARRYDLGPEAFHLTAAGQVEIFTDPTALEIIIKNVLDNAVKYSVATRRRCRSTCSRLDTGHLGIIVRDQGIGIDRNQLKRIFKRFHRAPGSARERAQRLGTRAFTWPIGWCAISAAASGPNPTAPARAPPCASACR